jgi:hypothetical protein
MSAKPMELFFIKPFSLYNTQHLQLSGMMKLEEFQSAHRASRTSNFYKTAIGCLDEVNRHGGAYSRIFPLVKTKNR